MSKHVLIGGGTGFIGSWLGKHLCQKGYDVTIVSRMPGPSHITWHELEKNGVPSEVTAVVNLAGQNVLDPSMRWTPGFKQNVWNSRVNTTTALVKAISASPNVKTFVNISGISHYRPHFKKVYTEKDQVEGFDFMSNLCMAWEKAATLPDDVAKNCRGVKIRTGVVIGRDGGMIQSMWWPFKLGVGGPLGTGKQYLPWIHVVDLCRLISHSIERCNCEGAINGVAPQIITNGEFCKAFAAALHRPCLFAVPEFVVQLMFGQDRSALLLTGAQIKSVRTTELGFGYQYPTAKDACQEVVNWKE